jgi:hypothetical protein
MSEQREYTTLPTVVFFEDDQKQDAFFEAVRKDQARRNAGKTPPADCTCSTPWCVRGDHVPIRK